MPTGATKSRTSSLRPSARRATLWAPIRPSPYWGHGPGENYPQAGLLSSLHLEVLYGGAAGGGKTDALLMAALQFADIPGYKALLLRRTFPELSQASGLIDRSQEWLGGKAQWNEAKHRWTFPSGAILEFGYLQRSTDRFRYQGAEFDFIGFDELTHFDESDYLYLFSRLRRREGSPIPPRMRAGSNPGSRATAGSRRGSSTDRSARTAASSRRGSRTTPVSTRTTTGVHSKSSTTRPASSCSKATGTPASRATGYSTRCTSGRRSSWAGASTSTVTPARCRRRPRA